MLGNRGASCPNPWLLACVACVVHAQGPAEPPCGSGMYVERSFRHAQQYDQALCFACPAGRFQAASQHTEPSCAAQARCGPGQHFAAAAPAATAAAAGPPAMAAHAQLHAARAKMASVKHARSAGNCIDGDDAPRSPPCSSFGPWLQLELALENQTAPVSHVVVANLRNFFTNAEGVKGNCGSRLLGTGGCQNLTGVARSQMHAVAVHVDDCDCGAGDAACSTCPKTAQTLCGTLVGMAPQYVVACPNPRPKGRYVKVFTGKLLNLLEVTVFSGAGVSASDPGQCLACPQGTYQAATDHREQECLPQATCTAGETFVGTPAEAGACGHATAAPAPAQPNASRAEPPVPPPRTTASRNATAPSTPAPAMVPSTPAPDTSASAVAAGAPTPTIPPVTLPATLPATLPHKATGMARPTAAAPPRSTVATLASTAAPPGASPDTVAAGLTVTQPRPTSTAGVDTAIPDPPTAGGEGSNSSSAGGRDATTTWLIAAGAIVTMIIIGAAVVHIKVCRGTSQRTRDTQDSAGNVWSPRGFFRGVVTLLESERERERARESQSEKEKESERE